jgi:hypothetical protein
MTYASGGLIQASDFNNIVGGSAGTQAGGAAETNQKHALAHLLDLLLSSQVK